MARAGQGRSGQGRPGQGQGWAVRGTDHQHWHRCPQGVPSHPGGSWVPTPPCISPGCPVWDSWDCPVILVRPFQLEIFHHSMIPQSCCRQHPSPAPSQQESGSPSPRLNHTGHQSRRESLSGSRPTGKGEQADLVWGKFLLRELPQRRIHGNPGIPASRACPRHPDYPPSSPSLSPLGMGRCCPRPLSRHVGRAVSLSGRRNLGAKAP